ncbi:helix-turn-helix domain-containing protein [Caloramator australicus]|uniref:Helix-turn-helix domain-containing protein n=1 Tax=Caloramator australicus RC3 TaxID=857293 RepID=I7LG84_9CLOT|nr:helix-turn-helix domain-containing protein [Caloramator australicus]CCJ33085.1 hypothetical protein CAAU_1001 [Caloramator australicus RC3]
MQLIFNSREELERFIQNEIVDTSEALEILGCSRQNLNDLIKRGKIKPIKEMKRDRLFFKSDILARKEGR